MLNQPPDLPDVLAIQAADWLMVHHASNVILVRSFALTLDEGEAEALALAIEMNADLLLVDERKARRTANQLGIRVTGLIGVLVEAKQKGIVPRLKPVLDALRQQARFWVGEALYHEVLAVVHED